MHGKTCLPRVSGYQLFVGVSSERGVGREGGGGGSKKDTLGTVTRILLNGNNLALDARVRHSGTLSLILMLYRK